MKALGSNAPKFIQSISNWAKGYGKEKVIGQQTGVEPSFMFEVANSLWLKRIHKGLGLDECRLCIYGAAPLKQSSVDYFSSLNLPLFNCYGLSETAGIATVQYPIDFSLNHAGRCVAGGLLKIDNPDGEGKGEICLKGRHVMMGYFKNEKATRECIDEDGWFKTGDQGKLEQGDFLKITGRIKELIITAGGENIAPVPIEDNFKLECPACSNIILIGENRRFMSAIITFKVELDMSKGGLPSINLDADCRKYFKEQCGLDLKTSKEACTNQKVIEHVAKCVEATNKKAVSRAAHIKKFKLVPMDFS